MAAVQAHCRPSLHFRPPPPTPAALTTLHGPWFNLADGCCLFVIIPPAPSPPSCACTKREHSCDATFERVDIPRLRHDASTEQAQRSIEIATLLCVTHTGCFPGRCTSDEATAIFVGAKQSGGLISHHRQHTHSCHCSEVAAAASGH